jgi:hypothetical protein
MADLGAGLGGGLGARQGGGAGKGCYVMDPCDVFFCVASLC